MGDILHALPAVTALRRAHPGWQIDWAVEPQWMPLLAVEGPASSTELPRSASRPLVDKLFVVPAKQWSRQPLSRQTLRDILTLRRQLREGGYDAVIDMQGSVRSGLVARFTGCRRIIGEETPREPIAKWLFSERVATCGVHVIEQDIELAAAVAGDELMYAPAVLPYDEAAEEWCDVLEGEMFGTARSPILLIHPGAGWGAKRWPVDRYGVVAEEFAQRGGVSLVSAGPGEEELANGVVEAAHGFATMVRCSIAELIALTRRVSVVVGGDTGPLHLACALERPVVGIYGPTEPDRNGPFGTKFIVLRNPESRRDHTRREEPEAGLLTIMPKAVMTAVMELLLHERTVHESEPEQTGGQVLMIDHGQARQGQARQSQTRQDKTRSADEARFS